LRATQDKGRGGRERGEDSDVGRNSDVQRWWWWWKQHESSTQPSPPARKGMAGLGWAGPFSFPISFFAGNFTP